MRAGGFEGFESNRLFGVTAPARPGRRHFSLCGADLTRSSDVARADFNASRIKAGTTRFSHFQIPFELDTRLSLRQQKTADLLTRPVSSGGEPRVASRQLVPSRSMAHSLTSSFRARATMASYPKASKGFSSHETVKHQRRRISQ